MNAKLCKKLRQMAFIDTARRMQNEDRIIPIRALQVHPPHEERAKTHGLRHVTAVNDPDSWRGVYRRMKKEHRNATSIA